MGTVGKSFLITNPPRAVFASYLIRLTPEKNTIEPEYLYAFLQSDGYWQQLRIASRGGAQPNVNATLLGNLKLPVPSTRKQQAMLVNLREQTNRVTMLIVGIEKELETINCLPRALLGRAFTGGL
jgi:type I restriction enzyme S subunit